jgi:alanine-glyoxylate transaminase/serine-glyoxylate transaminase/serine-pyruvate transaminase
METCLVNLIEASERVLVVEHGVFGQRLGNLAEKMGAQVTRLRFEWGTAADPETISRAVEQTRPTLLCIVNGETSTGVHQTVNGLKDVCRTHDTLLLVDCVTTLGGMPVDLDAWGVDAAYSATQKCLGCPPGLAPVMFNERALSKVQRRVTPVPSFYFDLREIAKYVDADEVTRAYHHTAPINMIFGLHAALRLVLEEGMPARVARHLDASSYLIERLTDLGFSPLVRSEHRLWPLTTLRLPSGIDEARLRRRLLSECGIEVGGGLGALAGSVWRIGLMGENARRAHVDSLLDALRVLMR